MFSAFKNLHSFVHSKSADSHLYLEASSYHMKSSKNWIIKGVALRSPIICSSMDNFKIKSSEYMVYLVARGHSAKLGKYEFDKVSSISRHEARKKVKKSFESKVIFTSTFNPRSPNVSQIINRHLHLIKNPSFLHNIFSDGSKVAANRRCQNLKDSLVRGDPYNKKHDLTEIIPYQYKPCSKQCDLSDNFVASQSYVISNATGYVISNATEKKCYIRLDSTCSTPNVVYMAYCKKCERQSVGSTN